MYQIKKLKDNLKIITVPIRGTKTAAILVIIKTGSKYENKNNNGISHFIEHMLFKGTEKRPDALTITNELDEMGGEYSAFTSKEYTGYWVKVDSKKINSAIDVVNDILLNSKFENQEIQKEKGVIIEEMNMYRDNPMLYIEDIFEQCLYGNTPAGRDTLGTKENILKFKRKDLFQYFKSNYRADNTIICLVGNISKNINQNIQNLFNSRKIKKINKQEKTCFTAIKKQIKPKTLVYYKNTDQTTLSLGIKTFPINHRYEFIGKIISVILGGSMSSRLFIQLREKHSLAYYVKTRAEFYSDSGYLTTQAGVPSNQVEKAIKIILTEYKKLTEQLVNKQELLKIKNLICGHTTIQLELLDNVAEWYAIQAILRKNILTPDDFFAKIKKITEQDIKKVANSIFMNKNLNFAIIGPFKNGKQFEKILKI